MKIMCKDYTIIPKTWKGNPTSKKMKISNNDKYQCLLFLQLLKAQLQTHTAHLWNGWYILKLYSLYLHPKIKRIEGCRKCNFCSLSQINCP